jgi:hypothetical protein
MSICPSTVEAADPVRPAGFKGCTAMKISTTAWLSVPLVAVALLALAASAVLAERPARPRIVNAEIIAARPGAPAQADAPALDGASGSVMWGSEMPYPGSHPFGRPYYQTATGR